jgi:hypothetical protein
MWIKMNDFDVNIPVLIIFWARPEQLKQTFAAVRQARPSTLLLWQDGPRSEKDLEKIQESRKIVEDIDWNCTVYKHYNEQNYGCDPSTHYAHKWAFTLVDKCIILEDDIVASKSFFRFCKAMLDRYEQDERIDRICGINLLGQYDCGGSDYFFMEKGNSWGWATWRRVAQKWESDYAFLDNPYAMELSREGKKGKTRRELITEKRRASGVPYWEFIVGYETFLNSRLCIYPRVNMIKNVGVGMNAAHAAVSYQDLPKYVRRMFFQKTYDLTFPLKEPKYVIHDSIFCKKILKILSPSPIVRRFRKMVSIFYRVKKSFKKVSRGTCSDK